MGYATVKQRLYLRDLYMKKVGPMERKALDARFNTEYGFWIDSADKDGQVSKVIDELKRVKKDGSERYCAGANGFSVMRNLYYSVRNFLFFRRNRTWFVESDLKLLQDSKELDETKRAMSNLLLGMAGLRIVDDEADQVSNGVYLTAHQDFTRAMVKEYDYMVGLR